MEPLRIVKLRECSQKERELLLKRSEMDVDSVILRVIKIVSDVRRDGDRALLEYTERFDGVKLSAEELRVSEGDLRLACGQVGESVVKAIEVAAEAIRKFHLKQLPRGWKIQLAPGVKAGQLVRPLESVGVYVPGGLARYPSSLLMAAVPAKVAGVERVIVCTPPGRDGKIDAAVLVAAKVAGVDAVFKVGGAQAIAAMAYGTETVPKVDKIVGPGNVYVVAAKQVVAPNVDIDFAAGPTEILIIADRLAEPRFIAADLLSQAEHDTDAAAVLVTTSEELASKVRELTREMLKESPRWQIAIKALTKYGRIVVVRNLGEAIEFANAYAPEHLELMVKQPRRVLKRIKNAGSIFVGDFTPVAAGDLAVGPNHILPTGGAAKRRSGLSVLDFVRLPTVQELSKQGLERVAEIAERLAEVEGLPGHARSIKERLKEG
ncbi:MAG: histidinol dehydrogenase [Candidatus Hodarchaeaceae archaeon]|nr:histidinol dehydrogenase [Candidatus Hodarchaeaceae archaeon]